MNFWTFVDRNSTGLFWLALAAIFFIPLSCGMGTSHDGCRIRIGSEPATADAGAP